MDLEWKKKQLSKQHSYYTNNKSHPNKVYLKTYESNTIFIRTKQVYNVCGK
jgi:hypothetical protein